MDKIMEKLNKLSLPVVILIASIILGGFYYASEVNKQKSIERQQQVKIEQEKQDQLAKELKEQQAKEETEQALNACIADAEERYSNQWYRECKGQGELTNRCISLHEMTYEEYLKQNNIPQDDLAKRFSAIFDFEKEKDECSCRLPTAIANDIGDFRDGLRADCFKKYPQK